MWIINDDPLFFLVKLPYSQQYRNLEELYHVISGQTASQLFHVQAIISSPFSHTLPDLWLTFQHPAKILTIKLPLHNNNIFSLSQLSTLTGHCIFLIRFCLKPRSQVPGSMLHLTSSGNGYGQYESHPVLLVRGAHQA